MDLKLKLNATNVAFDERETSYSYSPPSSPSTYFGAPLSSLQSTPTSSPQIRLKKIPTEPMKRDNEKQEEDEGEGKSRCHFRSWKVMEVMDQRPGDCWVCDGDTNSTPSEHTRKRNHCRSKSHIPRLSSSSFQPIQEEGSERSTPTRRLEESTNLRFRRRSVCGKDWCRDLEAAEEKGLGLGLDLGMEKGEKEDKFD